MGTNANVVKGCGLIYTAAEGTALPTITSTLGGSITWTNWTNVGHQENDFALKIMTEYEEFRPAGEIANVLALLIGKGADFAFKLAESDADALNLALQNSSLSSAVVSDGGDAAVTYKAVAIQTPLLVYHFKRVILNVEDEITLDDKKRTLIPVTGKCFLRTGDTAGQQLFRIHERT